MTFGGLPLLRKLALGVLVRWQLLFYCIIQSWHLIFNASVSCVGTMSPPLGDGSASYLVFIILLQIHPFYSALWCYSWDFPNFISQNPLLGLVGSSLSPLCPPNGKWGGRDFYSFFWFVILVIKVHKYFVLGSSFFWYFARLSPQRYLKQPGLLPLRFLSDNLNSSLNAPVLRGDSCIYHFWVISQCFYFAPSAHLYLWN